MSADKLHSLSERELVARFRADGENRYFAELYRRERRRVYGVCLKFLRDPAAAEDVCHEAFVRAFEHFGTFEGERFSAWVRRIAANQSVNRLQSKASTVEPLMREVPAAEPELDRRAISHQELSAALAVIRTLGAEQRRAFVLFHIEGLSYQEIADCTGLAPEAVRSHLQNARRNLHLRWARTPHAEVVRTHE